MPNKLTTNATLSLAASIGRMSAADREATLRLFVGAVAEAVAQDHTTPEVIGTMDDLIRFGRLTADRVLRKSGLDKHQLCSKVVLVQGQPGLCTGCLYQDDLDECNAAPACGHDKIFVERQDT